MSKRASFIYGFFLALTIIACSSFGYTRFGYDYEGQRLLHWQDSAKDLPANSCSRGEDGTFKCIVMFSDDFYKLKEDYQRLVDALEECQRE